MKIKIITIHDLGNNFGSTLQACALCNYLMKNGYKDVELINYLPSYTYHGGKIVQLIKKVLFLKDYITQHKRFENYFKLHCKRTKVYKTFEELKEDERADIYIVGSDQVWNEFYDAGRDDAYYLGFTDCKNKISYSTSLGQLHTYEELSRIKEKTKEFKYIAVREQASVKQLHEIGMKYVQHVLDPVFLFDKYYYINKNYKNKYGKYLLVYSVNNDKLMNETAQIVAERMNLKIVLVGGYMQKLKHDYYLRNIGPQEFVDLINNAKFVIANSFHATAMSIILNKKFALVLPKYSPLRLKDILEVAEIKDRVVEDKDSIEKIFKDIDYERVNKTIDLKRKNSQKYLIEAIKNIDK